MSSTIGSLFSDDDFLRRHIGPNSAEMAAMLEVVGAESLDNLVTQTVPAAIRCGAMALPGPISEQAALAELRGIASKNQVARSFIGMGYHDTVTPPVILRNVL